MNPAAAKLAVSGVAFLLLYLFGRKGQAAAAAAAPSGNVDIGVPTVDGVYGGDYTTPAAVVPTDSAAADQAARDHARLTDLVDESNQAIANFDKSHPENQELLDQLGP